MTTKTLKVVELSETDQLRAASTTSAKDLAGIIITGFRKGRNQELDVVGAGPCNVVAKAVTIVANELIGFPTGVKDVLVRIRWFDGAGTVRDKETGAKEPKQISGLRFTTFYVVDGE